MASVREYRRHDAKNVLTMDRHKARGNGRNAGAGPNALVAELAELVRELHQTLEDYGPVWFTKTMDDRIRQKLAAAEFASATFHD